MTDPIAAPSILEAGELLRRLALFLKDSPESVQKRFDRLLADIDADALRPSYVADVLSSLIRDGLAHTCARMPTVEDRRLFTRRVVEDLDRVFGDLMRVSKTTQIYASDLKEVWIACEPLLDLLPEPEGFLDTVADVLTRKKVQYVYFLSDNACFQDLVSLLKERHVSTDRIRCEIIPESYRPPVALYIHESRVVGLRGRGQPPMRRGSDGRWQLTAQLDPSWATTLYGKALQRHYDALSKHLKEKDS